MHIDRIPNRNSPPAYLLRETWRENGRVRKRTLANLSDLPQDQIEGMRRLLKGDQPVFNVADLEVLSARDHGGVAAVIQVMKDLGLPQRLGRKKTRHRQILQGLIAARVLAPQSKLATVESWQQWSLPEELGIEGVTAEEAYEALDTLLGQKERIEAQLAKERLQEGALMLYDVTSLVMAGTECPLAGYGYSRDGVRGQLQIEIGLATDAEGRPVAVEVFEGSTADPKALSAEIARFQQRLGLDRVIVVGDRGMVTGARIREDLAPEGFDWVSALRNNAIQKLAAEDGPLQLSLFDTTNLVELTAEDYPGERLVACRNPELAEYRAQKREALLQATEASLAKIATAVADGRLKNCAAIGRQAEKALARHKMAKHFHIEADQGHFRYQRNEAAIAAEAALDGIYVIRTSLGAEDLSAEDAVRHYKALSQVEQAFRFLKNDPLQIRPVYHYRADRVRAHVFLCMLAYDVTWELRRRLGPLLYDDEQPATHGDPVAPAEPSEAAQDKTRMRRNAEDFPVFSLRGLLDRLQGLRRTTMRILRGGTDSPVLTQTTEPDDVQKEAFRLVGVKF
jgi:hypothetical protein